MNIKNWNNDSNLKPAEHKINWKQQFWAGEEGGVLQGNVGQLTVCVACQLK